MPPATSAASGTISWSSTQQSGRLGMSPAELVRRAHGRLAERIDLAKSRHKPLSILRQEARRVVDQYYEFESPGLAKAERDKLVDDVLGEAYGFGPLEELFRDESCKEVMVLAHNQVISRKGENWLPTSARFRDAAQYRGYLARLGEVGEAFAPASGSGFDVKLPNGFRALGVLPPDILDQPPLVAFVRVEAPALAGSAAVATPLPRASGITVNTPRPGLSSVTSIPASVMRQIAAREGVGAPRAAAAPQSGPDIDPFARVKQRVTERIVTTCAAAGMYDLSQISTNELQRVVQAHVEEVATNERLNLEESVQQRLVVEILAAMNR